jgi:hypothetical protein
MTPVESALLMGFPASWLLPRGSRAGQRAVGNAMCGQFAQAIVEAATAVAFGTPPPLPPPPLPPPPPPRTRAKDEQRELRRLRKRLRAIEAQLGLRRAA